MSMHHGIDATMPQHSLQSHLTVNGTSPGLKPILHSIWHFFYESPADWDVLARVLQRDAIRATASKPARVHIGRLTKRAGKYRALLHADETLAVDGSAFGVEMPEEDALRTTRRSGARPYGVVPSCSALGSSAAKRRLMGLHFISWVN